MMSHNRFGVLAAGLLPLLFSVVGCSSICTEIPAVPVDRLPPQLMGQSREVMIPIALDRLRQEPPDVYRLDAGDLLGVYVENVLGTAEEAPPVHIFEEERLPPAIGFPVPVRDDGTVALPLVDPIDVTGMTLPEATEVIRDAYTVDRKILPEGKDRIIVTLMRRRVYEVMVVREEYGGIDGVEKRGTGYNVELPAYENDLLHALNETGGMPGIDAHSDVLIFRGGLVDSSEREALIAGLYHGNCNSCRGMPPLPDPPNAIRIPLRYHPAVPPAFTVEDIILQEGDIVLIQARDDEKFYTGGLLPGGEHLLPRDYDIDVLEAIALAGGSVTSGGTGIGLIGQQNDTFSGGGYAGIPPSRAVVVRRMPGGAELPIRINLKEALADPSQRLLIQPDDVIIVQYTMHEELTNAALSLVRFNFLFNSGGGF